MHMRIRSYRFVQPPANHWEPSGFSCLVATDQALKRIGIEMRPVTRFPFSPKISEWQTGSLSIRTNAEDAHVSEE